MHQTNTNPDPESLRPIFVRLPDVQSLLGVGRTTVCALLRDDPDFPRPIKIGGRNVAFRLTEIEEWAAAQRPREPWAASPQSR